MHLSWPRFPLLHIGWFIGTRCCMAYAVTRCVIKVTARMKPDQITFLSEASTLYIFCHFKFKSTLNLWCVTCNTPIWFCKCAQLTVAKLIDQRVIILVGNVLCWCYFLIYLAQYQILKVNKSMRVTDACDCQVLFTSIQWYDPISRRTKNRQVVHRGKKWTRPRELQIWSFCIWTLTFSWA